MKENKHGFEPKQEFTMGGIAWTVIQTGADWVKCIASDCVEERAFDEGNKNDFAVSSLRAYLNGEFLRRLIKAGAPEEMFEYFNVDLTADDGLKNYGGDRVRIGLITCEEYRLLRGNIPALPDRWWWTATPDSPINSFVRSAYSDGSLYNDFAYIGTLGVRPLCNLKSSILASYLNGENAEEQKNRAEAVDIIKHMTTTWDIDAVEVVRCRDCKHAEPYKRMNGATGYYCHCEGSVFEYADRRKYTPVRESDDFCSYGERRTDNG